MLRDPNTQLVLSSRRLMMPCGSTRFSLVSLIATVRRVRRRSASVPVSAWLSLRMRCLFLCLFCLTTVVAQQGQTTCDQSVKHEEDNCCCTTYAANMCLSQVQDKVDRELNYTYQSAPQALERGPEHRGAAPGSAGMGLLPRCRMQSRS